MDSQLGTAGHVGSRPGKLCGFQGPRIHSPWGKAGDRLRPLSYQDVSGKMDGRAWAREGWERLLPGSRKAQALSRVPGSPEGRVRRCPVTGDSQDGGTKGSGCSHALPQRHSSIALFLSESEGESAQLWEEQSCLGIFRPLCGMGQVSYLISLNLGSSSIKSK